MLNPKRRPGKKTAPIKKWDYQPIPNGTSTVGFLAGPPIPCATHYVGATKPCKREMTESAYVCPYCESGKEIEWRAYVPFYSREYIELFVLINDDYLESVEEIPLHAQIRLSRAKPQKSPIVIRMENHSTRGLPPAAKRALPVDMMPFLVHTLWKDKDIIAYSNGVKSVAPKSFPTQTQPALEVEPSCDPPVFDVNDFVKSIANDTLAKAGHSSRITRTEEGELVPVKAELPSLNGYNKKHKPR